LPAALCRCPADAIKRIYSHPHALKECAAALLQYYPGVDTVASSSTSEGARLASLEEGSAALASAAAARLEGLAVVQRNMQNSAQPNISRFVVVCKASDALPTKTGDDKTIVFIQAKPDGPKDWLSSCLAAFSAAAVPVINIYSHMNKRQDGRHAMSYQLEFRGHLRDEPVQAVLDALRAASKLTVSGTFNANDTPVSSEISR